MKTSHEEAANILNKIFPGIEARAGYIGNVERWGDDRLFKIFTNIDIGLNQTLSLSVPEGEITAMTMVQLIRAIMRINNTKTVSPAVAQMLNAVRHAS